MSSRNLSLAQHLKAGQLPMFLTGGEIQKHYKIGDYEQHVGETKKEFWNRKEENAHRYTKNEVGFPIPVSEDKSLAADILKHGVKKPVVLYPNKKIAEGHHRTAVMAKGNPKGLVPVEHLEF